MTYIEIPPLKEISSFVKCFWMYENEESDVRHTILPNGYFELFMIFEHQQLVSVFLSGLRTKPFDVNIPKGITVSAIRFLLSASEYVLSKEIGSVLDDILPLDINFWGLQELSNLPFPDRVEKIAYKLLDIIKEREMNQDKLLLLKTVYQPDLSVQEVAKATQWDRRKINRYFNSQFGISLKTFLSIIRFRSSFDSVKEGILYPELNYYDQSHYIKEVKKYTGESPKKLLKNEDDRFLQFSVNKKT